MNILDVRKAMQSLHPAMRFGHHYLPAIKNGEVSFKVWNSPDPEPTTAQILAAIPDHAPTVEERIAILEVHAQTPIPAPDRPEWWQTADGKVHPDVPGKPERTP